MAENRHIIKRQVLEIGVADKAQTDQVQLHVRKIFHDNLLKMMNAILDEVSPPNQLHQIERLEIDFGEIALSHLGEELSNRFKQDFKKAVLDAIKKQTVQIATTKSQVSTSFSGNQKEVEEGKTDVKKGTLRKDALQSNLKAILNGNDLTQVPSVLELVLYFLQIGRLPWWAKAENTLLDNCIEILLEEQATLFIKELRPLLEDFNYRKRLISSIQSSTRFKLLRFFFSPNIEDFVADSLQKITLLSKETNLSKARLEWYFWDKALLFAIRTQEKSIWQSVVIKAFVTQLLEKENLDRQNLKVLLVQSGFTELEIQSLLGTKIDEAENIAKPTTPISNIRAFSASDKIYIDNAGLVLIWIFLNGFFERMRLVSEKKFVDTQSQHRAVRLLQYLFDASVEVLEYDLSLNKLLCGLSLDNVIEPQDALSTEEQNACEELLQGVLEHAAALGNISVDGFRASFFMREGVLSPQDQVWLLQIQQKEAYDILLNRLPWSYQVVKLPWMNKAIYVEW